MFKSDFSGKSSKPKETPLKLVIKKRKKMYENTINNKVKLSSGWEIAKEINILFSELEDAKAHYEIE